MSDFYRNRAEGTKPVKRMSDSTIGWVMNEVSLMNCLINEHSYFELIQFAHAVAEEVLARVEVEKK